MIQENDFIYIIDKKISFYEDMNSTIALLLSHNKDILRQKEYDMNELFISDLQSIRNQIKELKEIKLIRDTPIFEYKIK